MAEWLRRLTRNQIPSGSVGSSPADCEMLFLRSLYLLRGTLGLGGTFPVSWDSNGNPLRAIYTVSFVIIKVHFNGMVITTDTYTIIAKCEHKKDEMR